MPNMATVSVIGHLGADPETRFLESGQNVCSFSVAVTNKSRDGERTDWYRISAWGKLGEVCAQYLVKGTAVYVSGALTTRTYQDKNNENRTSLEVNAKDMQMLSGKRDGERSDSPRYESSPADLDSIPF